MKTTSKLLSICALCALCMGISTTVLATQVRVDIRGVLPQQQPGTQLATAAAPASQGAGAAASLEFLQGGTVVGRMSLSEARAGIVEFRNGTNFDRDIMLQPLDAAGRPVMPAISCHSVIAAGGLAAAAPPAGLAIDLANHSCTRK